MIPSKMWWTTKASDSHRSCPSKSHLSAAATAGLNHSPSSFSSIALLHHASHYTCSYTHQPQYADWGILSSILLLYICENMSLLFFSYIHINHGTVNPFLLQDITHHSWYPETWEDLSSATHVAKVTTFWLWCCLTKEIVVILII